MSAIGSPVGASGGFDVAPCRRLPGRTVNAARIADPHPALTDVSAHLLVIAYAVPGRARIGK
ncbi:hypothetical protein GCM10010425_20090 [Streptomyces spororaveus]|uniref:Uncharacterized protein n=1 Tax=Streptomyces spororaveus TaxID=284039 RepID=A0ABQ3T7D8_9ACTN|nr:hypothetical protein Sspor_18590 [Streptomyces spororaveus]